MRMRDVKAILSQLSSEAKTRSLLGNASDELEVARLADQIIKIIDRGMQKNVLDEQTISFAPSRCPCCGR